MRYTNVCLHDFGYVLPPVVLTSAAIEERLAPVYERLKLPAGRLELMTGIVSRRLWPSGTRPSDGATQAGALALAKAAVPAQDISCLIFTSVSRDMMEGSSLSTLVQMVGAGIGVTLIPQMAVAIEASSAPVTVSRLAAPRPSRVIGMVWRKTNPLAAQLAEAAAAVRAAALAAGAGSGHDGFELETDPPPPRRTP